MEREYSFLVHVGGYNPLTSARSTNVTILYLHSVMADFDWDEHKTDLDRIFFKDFPLVPRLDITTMHLSTCFTVI